MLTKEKTIRSERQNITIKGVKTFKDRSKQSSKYVGSYEVTEKLSPVAYRLALPIELKHGLSFVMFHCFKVCSRPRSHQGGKAYKGR